MSKTKFQSGKILFLILFFVLFSIKVFADGTLPTGAGTSGDPYQIATLDNLLWVSTNDTSWSSHFIQTADIDASATSTWNGGEGFITIGTIGNIFAGTYDGQEHTIDSLYIDRPSYNYQGLFGRTTSSTIENLGVTNVDVNGNGATGGLVGYNNYSSTISNCYSTGSVSGVGNQIGGLVGFNSFYSPISNCYSTGSVSGGSYTGGLVGYNNNSMIQNCYSTGSVSDGFEFTGGLVGYNNDSSIIKYCYSTGSVSGSSYTGGLVGYNYNSTIHNCYSTGSVSGTTDIGGLVGYNNYSSSENYSFWNTETSGQATSAGGTGKTTAEMQTESTFTNAGWDFVGETANGTNDHWGIVSSFMNGYPFLTWQAELLSDYTASPLEVFIGTVIQFTDNSYGTPTEWQWDFENDGTYDSTEQDPSHIYNTAGIYSVKLTVSNGTNTGSYIRTDYIIVNSEPAAPQNVQVVIAGDDANISWDAVTVDVDGVPINLDGYVIKYNEWDTDDEHYYFLWFTTETNFTHEYVTIHSPQMFYQVFAFKSYSTRQLEYLKKLNNSKEKIKWSEVEEKLEELEIRN